MGAVVLDAGVKPEQWGWDSGFIDPTLQLDGLVGLLPLWEKGGAPSNILTRKQMSTVEGAPSWDDGPLGTELVFSGAQGLGVDDAAVDLSGPMSLLVVHHFNGDYTNIQALADYSNDGGFLKWHLEFGRTDNKYTWLNNGGFISHTSTRAISDDLPHVALMTRDGVTSDWDLKLYIDGVKDSETLGDTNNPNSQTDMIFRLGVLGSNLINLTGSLIDVLVWDRALSEVEAVEASNDIFSFVRMRVPMPFFVPAAAAGGGRIMSSLARHGGLAGIGGIAGPGGGLAA